MIRLHCTKKLLAKLPLREGGRLKNKRPSHYPANEGDESPLSGWHANLILLQRRQCVLLVHDATRFPVFIPALKKADFAELDYWFADGFMNALLKTGADDVLMDCAHAALGPLVCDTECDRSVQGTMNRMAQDIEHMLWYEDASVMDLARAGHEEITACRREHVGCGEVRTAPFWDVARNRLATVRFLRHHTLHRMER
ncbi:MAG: hypothetical protein DIZ78_16495 [endosymbiont of Escarpia spicata]|uniref:DUF6933 domain-containing protein n=1 Tax=endosymbiont of Escarpia spicata TaxID=2200908 RepID=A0A370DAX9_9GAMM|nr:MAG: hypothetical protein DIZ78_16495 [endosymbiont of Escarpia spicata]